MINARFDSLHRINIKKYQNLSLYVKKCEINKKVWPCEKLVWCLRTNDILIWFWIKKTSLTRRCNSSNCEHNLFSDLLQFYHVRVSFNRVHICTIKVLKEKSLTITKNFCRIELDHTFKACSCTKHSKYDDVAIKHSHLETQENLNVYIGGVN